MSNEREFMENLLQQRFDFLLVVYSLFVAGAMSADSQLNFQIALTTGAIICLLLWMTVYRIYTKVDVILTELHKDSGHPVAISSGLLKRRCCIFRMFGVNQIIGWVTPAFCTFSFAVAAVFAWLERIGPPSTP